MSEQISHGIEATNLADILERVLDKGIVIAGDIQIKLADVELLTIKIRLMIASVDKAKEMGIDWWETDSYLSSRAKKIEIEEDYVRARKMAKKPEKQLKFNTKQ
ncbi:gas vesicle protein [Patescibacteria group bacterium]|nr:gas vesicle protein [Candidatus Falkowbacteria bacterium]MBU3906022.1 gas vesicle protein [Patescibacteria group bacterium]MCG2695772.1 gas vesicle protein [Candidatus Parcubacteria bacterium]MBU4015095.1 gas vesicle protein [Patescibacteria group bacterium]MBU4026781.1 gas vesicle protein [Patescibacteria group bacterium]